MEILLIKITKSRHIKGIKLQTQDEIRAQTFADDTSLIIQRCINSLRAWVKCIKLFSKISGIHANIDKTKVIPFGHNFNIKDILYKEIPLEWEDSFTLLGINIDNKLLKLDRNFDKVHSKTLSLINDWRAQKIPLQGRINISKCLLVSQYTYVASILTLSEDQITKAQTAINNYIMDSSQTGRN